ncbi:MAG: 2,3-bisphosphoglycerate-independent phosphoglycerate mutase [Candidatus Kerfeldbacteria bacterium]|nr:2,3-bisphosphoglycerate-independent phosphoglycerate mutase [Candidatus Kerfeldbacteria bacterium]
MSRRSSFPLVMIIFDGWGIAPRGPGNAIALAKTPVMDTLAKTYPSTTLAAAGSAVGLPTNQAGNSEAGHMNIGAGRVVEQDSIRISRSINEGTFFKNAAFQAAVRHVQKHRSQLHLIGLLTEQQSAHADPDHLLALLTLARTMHVSPVQLHLFTDGRDSPPTASIRLLRRLEPSLQSGESIATIIGRFYAMDRKKVWSRTKRAYEAMVLGQGRLVATAEEAILAGYDRGLTDEFIEPTVVADPRQRRIQSNDAVIFFNLRSDRARQLTKVFVQERFTDQNPDAFKREHRPRNILFVAMTDFGPDLGEIYTAFPSVDLYSTFPVILRRYCQLYVAESEKFAHVTFFFNGGYDKPVAGENRVLIASPGVSSYDAAPEMSVRRITSFVVNDLQRQEHDVVVVNFANPDMIGHTGNLRAAVKAIEAVDQCVGQIRDAVIARAGTLVITADHGNAEEMLTPDGKSVSTEHTTNPVPFSIVTPKPLPLKLRTDGRLADVVPTVLDLLGVTPPAVMTGQSLIVTDHAA